MNVSLHHAQWMQTVTTLKEATIAPVTPALVAMDLFVMVCVLIFNCNRSYIKQMDRVMDEPRETKQFLEFLLIHQLYGINRSNNTVAL